MEPPEETEPGASGEATAPLSPTAFFHVARTVRTPGSRPAPRSLDLRAEEVIDDFRLVRRLGEGGMGEVWEAEQLSLARRVALKFMQPGLEDAGNARLFAREARAGGRLNHSGIVAVYATGESNGLHWIAQELVEGGSTLHDFLQAARSDSKLPRTYDQDVAELFRRIAAALHVAHRAGVLHRDLKPRNILIDPRGEPKIGDFGLARIVDEPTQLAEGAIAGTYTYMSPEQIAGAEIDARTDVFSLGVVMYEVLTGARPFGGGSREEVLLGITAREASDPRLARRTIPPELAVLCLRALEKRPEDRFQDAEELALELGRYLRDEPIRTRPPGLARRTRKWARRHPAGAAVLLVGALALLALVPLGRHLAELRHQRIVESRDRHFESAGRYFAVADVSRGLEEARLGIELDPAHPTGYLVAAAGFANAGLMGAAEAELERAARAGFRADAGQAATAQEHLALGLHAVVRGDATRYENGLAHLEQALEDSRLAPLAWYPIYTLRRSRGDVEGARLALDEYLRSVPSGAPMYGVLRAESFELSGRLTEALAELDRITADEELMARLDGVPLDRRRARVLIALGRLELAEEALERVLANDDQDAAALLNLALVNERLAGRPGLSTEVREARCARARELALQGTSLDPYLVDGWAILGKLALTVLQPHAETLVPGEDAAWGEARECVERLRTLGSADQKADQLESGLLLLEGYWHERCGRRAEAIAAYAQSSALNEEQIRARMQLGRLLCAADDYAGALEPLRAAKTLLDLEAPRDNAPTAPDLLRIFHLDLFAVATRAGDAELALRARDELEQQLAEGWLGAPLERLYFAWSLATAVDETLRDLDLACALLAEVREELAALGIPDVLEMIEEVTFACEE